MYRSLMLSSLLLGSYCDILIAEDDPLIKQAQTALRKATQFYRTRVSAGGGYLWQYSSDLKQREGERPTTESTVWVQPPGTPSVGGAYLRAWQATGDRYYLESAFETGMALVRGQLRSGGWDYRIELDPKERKRYNYRVEPDNPKGRNVTTLDDNNTQEAVRFLMRLDQALDFKNETIHEAVQFALTSLLKAQYPNGAWPQRFREFPDPKKYPVKKADYPESWSRTYVKKDYRDYYTLNDNTLADMIDVMLEAGRIFKDEKYHKAALRGGDFLILAQMPEPQPIWAQQYDANMHPAWARRFEPPSVTGGESQGVMRTLLNLYRETGEKKYLKPLPAAIAHLRKVQLSNNQVARFYELKTAKPLYFTKTYELTYKDDDLPTHYGFKTGNKLDSIEREHEKLSKLDPQKLKKKSSGSSKVSNSLRTRVKGVVGSLDAQGRWVEMGRLRSDVNKRGERPIISSRTFVRNVDTLSSFLKITRQAK